MYTVLDWIKEHIHKDYIVNVIGRAKSSVEFTVEFPDWLGEGFNGKLCVYIADLPDNKRSYIINSATGVFASREAELVQYLKSR